MSSLCRALLGAVLAVVAAAAPSAAWAQTGEARTCTLHPGPREFRRVATGAGNEMLFISGPARFDCTGGITVEADSAVHESGPGRLRLIGHVFYQDSAKTLTAEWVNYLGREERLLARGDVVLTDQNTGSVIRGPELEYLKAGDLRDVSLTIVEGRAHAVLVSADTTAGAAGPAGADTDPATTAASSDSTPPMEVDADRMEIRGEETFLATGRVELRRGETRGFGEEAEYAQATGRLVLQGAARIEDESFQLLGERITATLEDGDRLRQVTSREDAVLLAEELQVEAPEVRILFREGELNRLIAWQGGGPETPVQDTAAAADTAAAGPPAAPEDSLAPVPVPRPARTLQARLIAEEVRVIADSIDAVAPGEQLEKVVAVGDAYSERRADSVQVDLPTYLATDWIRGDTITGFFTADTSTTSTTAAPDSAGAEGERARPVLERIVAVGGTGHARSVYRMASEDPEVDRPGINYVVAKRLTLSFHDGEVQEMEAEGPIRGIHLQPKNEEAAGTEGEEEAPPPVTEPS